LKETLPVQRFPALSETGVVEHGFMLRIPGLDVKTDRETALQRLEHYHRDQLASVGPRSLRLAEQIHGAGVAAVDDPDVVLGIHVADCCAVFLVDPIRRVIGLVHSGKKGTERNIVGAAIRKLRNQFHSESKDLIAVLSPCIRPPYYEVDFAESIVAQIGAENVGKIYDDRENTGSDLERFYSYRMEKGRTGRMLAYLALRK
jgi:copper oxidase (laccase) domain-containing protein